MSKRLQVLLDDAELADFKRIARSRKLTMAEWVRQALRRERGRYPDADAQKKINVVREAYAHQAPVSDMDQMNREIESGYLGKDA